MKIQAQCAEICRQYDYTAQRVEIYAGNIYDSARPFF